MPGLTAVFQEIIHHALKMSNEQGMKKILNLPPEESKTWGTPNYYYTQE
jgi:hypothetical protein